MTTRTHFDATPRTAARRPSVFRGDLEGLRAFAVLLVVLDHLFLWPSGGFIGVDVFFVLSGFLITSLLIKEFDRTGSISFRGFYVRRIKRIVPVSTLVLAVTCLAAWLVWLGARVTQTFTDAVWALFFASNWHFAAVGTNYFQHDRPPSPIQHYWSLSLEEQFYFIWPWLLLLALGWSMRRAAKVLGRGGDNTYAKSRYRTLVFTASALTIASFIWCVLDTTDNATAAYFSSLSRAWELALGALLAALAIRIRKIPTPIRVLLSACGLAIVLAGGVLLDPSMPFPGPWAIIPVVGTALVIVAGFGSTNQRFAPLLGNRVFRYIGLISFSIYLWHWPVVVILPTIIELTGPAYYALALALILVLSIGSYHLVENPIRRSGWLTGKKAPHTRIGHNTTVRDNSLLGVMIVIALVVSTLAFSRSTAVLSGPSSATGVALVGNGASSTSAPGGGAAPAGPDAELHSALLSAMQASSWPDFQPSMDVLEDSKAPEWTNDKCIDVTDSDLQRCTYGSSDAPKKAVLVGDSVAISWMPGLRAALEPAGYSIQSLTLGQCPASDVGAVADDGAAGFTDRCNAFHQWAGGIIETEKPDLLIMASAENSLKRLASGAVDDAAAAEWTAASTRTLTKLAPYAKQIVVLAPPPQGRNLQGCVTKLNDPGDCLSEITPIWWTMNTADKNVVGELAGDSLPVKYVDTRLWFCAENNYCPAFVGTTPTRADENHLTGDFSKLLGPVLSQALVGTA